jgi:hypothetical protein
MKAMLTVNGVGTDANTRPIPDGATAIQAAGDGLTTFRIMGRLGSSAEWVELVAAGTADLLQSIPALPYVQLEVTAGTGTVNLYIG